MKKNTLTQSETYALKYIRNELVHTGSIPSFRKLMLLLKYKSPRSVSIIFNSLIDKGYIKKDQKNGSFQLLKDIPDSEFAAQTINVPLIGNIACGEPLLAMENSEGMISISTKLAKPPHKHFLLRCKGDSMNLKNIYDGTLVLVRIQNTARNGDIVVALIDDEATLKEFQRDNNFIILKPHSTNKEHKPIILTDDFRIQGVVVTTLPNLN